MSAPSRIPGSGRNQTPRGNTNATDFPGFDEFLDIIYNQDWENNPIKNRATQVFRNENISGKGGLCQTSHFVPASSTQKKESLPERLTFSQQQVFFKFCYIPCYCQLVRNTAAVTKPNSPLSLSHIPEVISHLQLGYLLWATTDLPRTEEDVSCWNSTRPCLRHHPPFPQVGGFTWAYFVIIYHANKTSNHHQWFWCGKRGVVCRSQIWYEEGHGERQNRLTGIPGKQSNNQSTCAHKMTKGSSKQHKYFCFVKNLHQMNLVPFSDEVTSLVAEGEDIYTTYNHLTWHPHKQALATWSSCNQPWVWAKRVENLLSAQGLLVSHCQHWRGTVSSLSLNVFIND